MVVVAAFKRLRLTYSWLPRSILQEPWWGGEGAFEEGSRAGGDGAQGEGLAGPLGLVVPLPAARGPERARSPHATPCPKSLCHTPNVMSGPNAPQARPKQVRELPCLRPGRARGATGAASPAPSWRRGRAGWDKTARASRGGAARTRQPRQRFSLSADRTSQPPARPPGSESQSPPLSFPGTASRALAQRLSPETLASLKEREKVSASQGARAEGLPTQDASEGHSYLARPDQTRRLPQLRGTGGRFLRQRSQSRLYISSLKQAAERPAQELPRFPAELQSLPTSTLRRCTCAPSASQRSSPSLTGVARLLQGGRPDSPCLSTRLSPSRGSTQRQWRRRRYQRLCPRSLLVPECPNRRWSGSHLGLPRPR